MFARIGFRKINYMLAIALSVVLMAALPSCAQVAGAQSGPTPDSSDARGEGTDFSFYKPPQDTTPYPIVAGNEVKNVILLIGDGMGLGQVALARMTAAGMNGKLYMERLPIVGLMRTHAANQVGTDSAAAATSRGKTSIPCGSSLKLHPVFITPQLAINASNAALDFCQSQSALFKYQSKTAVPLRN